MKSVSRRTTMAAAAVGATLLLGGAVTGSAQAAVPTSDSQPESATGSVSLQSGDADAKKTKWARCTVQPNSPHWSKKGKSVIFKTRVSCKGNIPKVHVQVRGKLLVCPGYCPPSTAATSKETKVVAVNGGSATFYTPKVGGKKVRGDGKYQGKVTAQITSPFRGTKGSASSKMVSVNTP